jgi:hypothetical protein
MPLRYLRKISESKLKAMLRFFSCRPFPSSLPVLPIPSTQAFSSGHPPSLQISFRKKRPSLPKFQSSWKLALLFMLLIPDISSMGQMSTETHGDQGIILFQSDTQGFIYSTDGQTLKKSSPQGKELLRFSDPLLGAISSFDSSNPHKILVFYKDFNQVLWLDNSLSLIAGPLALEELGLGEAVLVGSSAHGGFWVFDWRDRQLSWFDANLKPQARSGPVDRLLATFTQPSFLAEFDNQVFLFFPDKGMMVFDRFASFRRTLPVADWIPLQVGEMGILGFKQSELRLFDPIGLSDTLLVADTKQDLIFAQIASGKLIMLNSQGIQAGKRLK